MRPFEFIIIFFSFIYSLALTHLLLAAAEMVRHRRQLVLSWPHALWMLALFATLAVNWLSFWDFHDRTVLSLPTIMGGFLLIAAQYLTCALAAPDFDGERGYDLRAFHEQEGVGYIGGFLSIIVISVVINFAGAKELGVIRWGDENSLVPLMSVPALAALFLRRQWIQIAAPLAEMALVAAFAIRFYPQLASA